jgi:3-isopropylmalate/(R)-2-methylmalate dehydratase small subunit
MKAFTKHTGIVTAMDRSNVDTDQIIPKQFLKRIERSGFGQFLFFDWRFLEDGRPNPEFELNLARNANTSVLLARRNFGSGSSREHAVWAIDDYGIRCVIAPSFADIFFNNCFKNGTLPIVLTEQQVDQLFKRHAESKGPYSLIVDLEKQTVSDESGSSFSFDIEPFRKHCLLHGLDDIALTLEHADKITEYETRLGLVGA